ncbi:MAG: peptidylprolyl isomerase [Planctomycetota bacterium]
MSIRRLFSPLASPLSNLLSRSRGPVRRRSAPLTACPSGLDELEPRVLLSAVFGAELPDLADLTNADNPVVRFETNIASADGFSHIDIELFVSDPDDPTGTVDNFLTYVRDGQYDETFIQRSQDLSADPNEPSDIIQGGRNRYDDATESVTAIAVRDEIDDEVGRTNDARTIAMAKTNSPNSATSQWFFNLVDNEDVLGPDVQTNGGFTVFGRVVDDRSWDVVLAIAGLDRLDLSGDLSDPQFGGGGFRSVPVADGFDDSDGFDADEFVTIINAEIIKPEGSGAFFEQAVFYPEGFSNFRTEETLTLVNPNASAGEYQIVARFAQGLDRDIVVESGTLEAGERMTVTLSGVGTDSRLIGFNPYALEVHSAFEAAGAEPISATLTRADFADDDAGLDPFAGEALFNPLAIPEADRSADLLTWTFADGERDDDALESFITWQNLTGESGEVTIRFFFDDQTSTELVTPRELGPYRRGGINLEGIGESVLPQKPFAAQVISTVPIVASISIFRLDQTDPAGTGAALALGVPGQAGTTATLADARRPDDGSGQIAVVNLGTTEAIVRLDFIAPDGISRDSVFNRIEAGQRRTFDLDMIPGTSIAADTPISVRVSGLVGGPSIAASYSAASSIGGGGAAVAPSLATSQLFADATFSTQTGFSEVISVFNPLDTATSVDFEVIFSDGEVLSVTEVIAAGRRESFDLSGGTLTASVAAIRTKIDSDPDAFSDFAVRVVSDAPVTASLTRIDADAGRRFTVAPTILGGLTPLA